jgi:ArsR family transcriptional regulator
MRTRRCCPADCAIRSDWEKELKEEKDFLDKTQFSEASELLKLLGSPLRLKIAFMLLNRDHCVCEIIYQLEEKQNLVSHNLGILISSFNDSMGKTFHIVR